MRERQFLVVFAAFLACVHSLFAQGTAFTYQGRLNDATGLATGSYDLQFALYDSTNLPGNLVTGPVTNSATSVSNGLFTVQLDFGTGVFVGTPLWLQIGVRTNGGGAFTTLSPRQPLTPSPYAVTAGNVASNGLSAGTYGNAVVFGNAANQFTGSFSGNGAGLTNIPGTLPAQTVSGVAVQAMPNTSYVLTNNPQTVVITLPPAPNVGDVVSIASASISGWQLAQNPGQTVLASSLLNTRLTWTFTGAPSNAWWAMASSADGTYLLSSRASVAMYVSGDAGVTWSLVSVPVRDGAVTVSADGSHMAAAGPGTPIWVSSNLFTSSLTNWVSTTSPSTNWSGIASSGDGSRLTAVINGGGIYLSSDFGSNWAPSLAPSNTWTGVAASVDGSRLAATSGSGIYTSTNFGTNWSLSGANTNFAWLSIASSQDGTRLVAASTTNIWQSADSGATWVLDSTPTNISAFKAVACSGDGTRIVAAAGGAGIVLSVDDGTTWSYAVGLPASNWAAVTSSAAGTFLAGANLTGGIYISKAATTVGTAGYLSGAVNTAVELRYMGNGQFLPISHEGNLLVY